MTVPPSKVDRLAVLRRLRGRDITPAELWRLTERVHLVRDATVGELLACWKTTSSSSVLRAFQLSPFTRLGGLSPRGRQVIENLVFRTVADRRWTRT
jgi:hypothetical protein